MPIILHPGVAGPAGSSRREGRRMSVGSPVDGSSAAVPAPIAPESAHERAVTPSGGGGGASCQAKEGEKEGAGKAAATRRPGLRPGPDRL